MTVIHKYPLPINDEPVIEMPDGAECLHAGLDPAGTPCIWALVYTDRPMRRHWFHVFGTGHQIDDTDRRTMGAHLGSFVHMGQFVWHVFEKVE